ncbi:MAG: hypothetical protein HY905_21170 [Deltaproteobacteria bacterium]|nr:hypothetical protein [Deltaproteobacteria bacterium]
MGKAFLAAAAIVLAGASARAVEIYPSDDWSTVTYVSTPVYHVYQTVDPVVTYDYHVDVRVDDVAPLEPDPFDDLGLVEVGAGYGGFYMPSLRESLLQAPRAHLALILDPVSVNLDVSVATGLEWGELDANGACVAEGDRCGTGELIQTSLGFAWRWNRHGHLHPTAGAGLELASLDPDSGDSTFGFTAAAVAGLIFEYPLPFGALEAGLDITGHVMLVAQDAYPLEDSFFLTFGGYAGYRF